MRIPAQSSGELVAELLRIISDLEYFLAQGHGCHSLSMYSVYYSVCVLNVCVSNALCGSTAHCRITSPCCHVATHSVCCVYESLWVYITLGKLLPLLATGCHCVQLPTGLPGQGVLLLWPLPSSDVVEFRVSQLVSRASRANNEPSLRRPALRLVLARPTENH